jgi:outer membrane lipoprotein-sorting protein
VRALSKTSYDFEQVEVRDSQGPLGLRSEQRRRLAGSGGRYRVEPIPSGPLYVFDGTYRWAYNPDRNEYTRAAGFPASAPNLGEFELASYRVKTARILRQENVELAAGPVVCQVVEAVADRGNDTQAYSPIIYWIDAARSLILKMEYTITFKSPERPSPSTTKVTEFFTKAAVGEPVEDALFRFTPPDGAVEVERLIFGPKSTLTGKDSPDFELKTMDGRTTTRASLRGQVTLLAFGAAAQEDPLAAAELVFRALRSSGLNVFYVAPMKFAAAGYSVPIAIDPGSRAG